MHIGKDISHCCNYFWFQIFTDRFIFFLRWLFIKNIGKTFLGYIFGRSFHLKGTKTALPSNNAFSINFFFFFFFFFNFFNFAKYLLHNILHIWFHIFQFSFIFFWKFWLFLTVYLNLGARMNFFFSLLVFVIIPANLRKKVGIFLLFLWKMG